jgi:uncharacterized protein DUF4279
MISETNQIQQEDLRPRCHVGFSIIGSSLDLDAISVAMSQASARTVRAGTKTVLGPQIDDVWSIGSPLGPLKPLEDHLDWLHSQIEPHASYLADLPGAVRTRVYIGFTLSQEQSGFAISPEHIRLFGRINAMVEMYIIVNFGDDSDETNGQAAQA